VPGLVHLAHAAGTDLVEQDIIAEHQVRGFPLRELRRLVPGELLLADQLGRELPRVLPLGGREFGENGLELLGRHHAAGLQRLDELLGRGGWRGGGGGGEIRAWTNLATTFPAGCRSKREAMAAPLSYRKTGGNASKRPCRNHFVGGVAKA
jgi:hypothetical protein